MKQRILIVDDNEDVRTILRLQLAKVGFDVATAGDGKAALDAVHRDQPSCVLLDLHMPNMDGFEFLSQLQSLGPNPPPVFVVTHYDDPRAHARMQQLGADAIFSQTEAMQRDFPILLKGLLSMLTAELPPAALQA